MERRDENERCGQCGRCVLPQRCVTLDERITNTDDVKK